MKNWKITLFAIVVLLLLVGPILTYADPSQSASAIRMKGYNETRIIMIKSLNSEKVTKAPLNMGRWEWNGLRPYRGDTQTLLRFAEPDVYIVVARESKDPKEKVYRLFAGKQIILVEQNTGKALQLNQRQKEKVMKQISQLRQMHTN